MTSINPLRAGRPSGALSVPSPLRCPWPVPPQRLGDLTPSARAIESPAGVMSAPGAGVAIHLRRAA